MAVLLVLDGVFAVRHERRHVREDMARSAELLGRSLRVLVAQIRADRGLDGVLGFLEEVDRHRPPDLLGVRWVWLDGAGGDADHAPQAAAALSAAPSDPAEPFHLEAGEGPEHRLLTYVPVPGSRPAALEIASSFRELEERTGRTVTRSSILLGGLLLASAATIFLLGVRLVGRPLAALDQKARRVGAGDLSGPLELSGSGELARLARSLNQMCEDLAAAREEAAREAEARIQTLEQLRHDDRLRTVGRLASGIAHELGTPLNVVSGRATLIAERRLAADQVVASAQIIRAQSERMTHIIRQLLDFARRGDSQREPLDAGRIAARTCELVTPTARKQGVTLECGGAAGPLRVEGNSSELEQVLTNLLMNAIQSMSEPGTVRVEVERVRATPPDQPEAGERRWIRTSVTDQGHGIDPERLEHVFEPFFTTKDVGSGTGLGLSIVYGIVRDHGGWVEAESELGRGSRFTFFLPELVS